MQNITKRQILEYLFVLIVAVGSLVFLFATPSQTSKNYNCSLSEISPDYPVQVKNECRKLRAENFKENLQKPK
jgi:hypothetical protein